MQKYYSIHRLIYIPLINVLDNQFGAKNYYEEGSLGSTGIEAVTPAPLSAVLCNRGEHTLHFSCLT